MKFISILSTALVAMTLPIIAMAQADVTKSPSYQAGIAAVQYTYSRAKTFSHHPDRLVEKAFIKKGAADAFNDKEAEVSPQEFNEILHSVCPLKSTSGSCQEPIGNKIKTIMNKLFHGSPFSKDQIQKINYWLGYVYMTPLKNSPMEKPDLAAFDQGVDAWAPKN